MGYCILRRVKKITKENKPYLQNISSSRTKALKFKGTKKDWSGAKKKKISKNSNVEIGKSSV